MRVNGMVSTSVRRIFSNLCIRTWQQTNIFASQNNNCLVNFEVKALFSSRKASFTTICANVLEVCNFHSRYVPPSLEVILKSFYPVMTWSYVFSEFNWYPFNLCFTVPPPLTSILFWSSDSPMIPGIRGNVCNFGIWRKQVFWNINVT